MILAGLAALVAVGIVLGLLLSWASTRALDAAGISGDGDAAPVTGPTTSEPTTEPTSEPDDGSDGPGPAGGPPAAPAQPTPNPPGQGSLVADPESAGSFEQVALTGRLPGLPAGATLQVERREGGQWVTFPVTTTTDASGGFATIVELGQLGANVLRLVDPGSSRSTPPVTVTVG